MCMMWGKQERGSFFEMQGVLLLGSIGTSPDTTFKYSSWILSTRLAETAMWQGGQVIFWRTPVKLGSDGWLFLEQSVFRESIKSRIAYEIAG